MRLVSRRVFNGNLWYIRSEVSREINGASNRSQAWEADGIQSSVVGNLVGTSNSLEERERDVGELAVGNKCQTSDTGGEVTNRGQVWRGDAVHVISVKSERSVDSCQRWDLDARNVTESHVGSPDQVGESNSQQVAIGVNVERIGDVGDLGVELSQVVVVINLESANCVQVDTAESAQEGVANGDAVGL